jgi:hypothetical protein
MRPIVMLAVAASLAGCAPQSTPGSADSVAHTFHALDPACVHKEIVTELTDHEWTVTSTTPPQIVARKQAPPWLNTAVLAAHIEPPVVTMTMTLTPSGSDVGVLLQAGTIIDPRVGTEKIEPIPPTAQMNAALRSAARRVERACTI